jgi:hypothetical protein
MSNDYTPMDDDFARIEAMRALEDRRRENRARMRVDNSRLYAESLMFFYCRYCGALVARLKEDYLNPPPSTCTDCQSMQDKGWHDGLMPSFPCGAPPEAEDETPYLGPAFFDLIEAST